MGPMMMFAGGAMLVFALMALFFVLVLLAIGAVGFALWGHDAPPVQQLDPAALLRERYARGEITRERYHQALLDLLHDRYSRDEIDLAELEERSKRILSE